MEFITSGLTEITGQGPAMFVLGIFAHWFKKLYETGGAEENGFKNYFVGRPLRTGFAVVGGALVLSLTGGLTNSALAACVGYIADSAASGLKR